MRRSAWSLVVTLFLSSTTWGAEPPAPLARYFPAQDLVVYAEFDGLDAHADAWKRSAAYGLLTKTTVGAMFEDIAVQFVEKTLSTSPGFPLTVDEVRVIAGHAARSGFAFGLERKAQEARPACVRLVVRNAAKGKVREVVDKVIGTWKDPAATPRTVDKPGGRRISIEGGLGPNGFAWWQEGDDLVLCAGDASAVDLTIQVLDGRQPSAVKHPVRAELAKAEDGFTPVGLAFLDTAAFPEMPPQFVAFGIDQVKRIEYRWGFQGDALMTVSRVVAPSPRAGLLTLFDQPTFGRKDLPSLPAGLARFVSFSVDVVGLYDRIASGFASSDPNARASFEAFELKVRELTGLRLRDDILTLLGSRVTYYVVPAKADAPTNALAGLAQGLFVTPASSVIIEVKDPKALAKVLDTASTHVQDYFKAQAEANSKPPAVRVHPLKGVEHAFVVSIAPDVLPLSAGFKPTFILGKQSLVIGSTPEAARAAIANLERGVGLPDTDPLTGFVSKLPDKMIFVNVIDAKRSLLPELIANLPGLIQTMSSTRGGFRPWFLLGGPQRQQMMQRQQMVMGGNPMALRIDPDHIPAAGELREFLFPSVYCLTSDDEGVRFTTKEAFPAFNPAAVAAAALALLLPAAQASRSAARRAQSVNNLKQIGLAMHNYHSTNNVFPPAAIRDKKGKALLSWRVAILPFIEQAALYNEFKLDEPWDSPHNKPLIARMPVTYAVPNSKADPGKTFYRGFSGESTLFDPKVKNGTGIQTVTDGTSNTIGIVEAKTAVIWTKPDEEIPFDLKANAPKMNDLMKTLGGHSPGGFNALFLDGSVRFIAQSVNQLVLKSLITRDGGEVIANDAF